jgi:glyoxalase family protein
MRDLAGLHHVTAVAGDPQRNVDFYTGFLGLRLVKVTVDFDAPGSYHLYYGDGLGNPGTLVTFLPRPGAHRGRKGTGQASVLAFAIRPDAVRYWAARLTSASIRYEGPIVRWDQTVLTFFDPDDLQIELVAGDESIPALDWATSQIPAEYGLQRLCGVTLIEEELEPTAGLLEQMPGWRALGLGPNHRFRYVAGPLDAPIFLDILTLPGMARGQMGCGAIHHVAWRSPSPEDLAAQRTALLDLGLHVSPAIDQKYFRAIYFREPGGVLFEMATDQPGFAVDEPAAALGSGLQLPGWLEGQRAEIEGALPALALPLPAGAAMPPAQPDLPGLPPSAGQRDSILKARSSDA